MQTASREHITARAGPGAEGSARRGADRVQEGAGARRVQPPRPCPLGGAREDHSRSDRGDAPEAADRRAARSGAPGRPRRCSTRRRRCRSSASDRTPACATSSTSSAPRPASTSPTTRSTQDKAYTVRLEDVTLEQALQQIMSANQLFYKVLNPKTIIVMPDNAQKHAQYDDLVVRVFYISHADVTELAQLDQHDHAHPDDAGAADGAAEQDRQHDHRARDGAGRGSHRAASSAPTTSRAPKSSSTSRSSK